MKAIAIVFVLLLAPSCLATGWSDFELDIGDGYRVFRANSMDVGIGTADGRIILNPNDYEGVGPVSRYITTPTLILTKNLGRKARNLFKGDTFEDVDPAKEFYFVIVKGTNDVRGPYSQAEFATLPDVVNLGKLDWRVPRNPSFWLPLLGGLVFIAVVIPILAVRYFWITIPLLLGLVLLVGRLRKQRRTQFSGGGHTSID
jgi:hypothetical protein